MIDSIWILRCTLSFGARGSQDVVCTSRCCVYLSCFRILYLLSWWRSKWRAAQRIKRVQHTERRKREWKENKESLTMSSLLLPEAKSWKDMIDSRGWNKTWKGTWETKGKRIQENEKDLLGSNWANISNAYWIQ